MAKDKEDLQDLAVLGEQHGEKYGLQINRVKTNVMAIHGDGVVKIDDTKLENVDKFK